MEVLDPGNESPITDWNGRAFKMVEKAVSEVFPGVETTPYIMTGGSDSRFMSIISDNCIRFAPFRTSDEQVSSIHGLNENIDVDSLEPAVMFYKYLIANF